MLPGTTEEAEASSGSSGYVAGVRRSRGSGSAGIATPCNQTLIVTKLWISDYGYDEALVGFDGCLRRLGLDYVDLFLLHHPVPTDFDRTVGAYKAIEEMLADGRTRAIGVSNFMADHLENLLRQVDVVPAVNQIEVHPYFSQPELRGLMAERGIATQSWSPIGGVYAYGAKNRPYSRTLSSSRSRTSTARRLRRSSCAGTSSTGSARSRSRSSHTGSPRTSTSSTSS